MLIVGFAPEVAERLKSLTEEILGTSCLGQSRPIEVSIVQGTLTRGTPRIEVHSESMLSKTFARVLEQLSLSATASPELADRQPTYVTLCLFPPCERGS